MNSEVSHPGQNWRLAVGLAGGSNDFGEGHETGKGGYPSNQGRSRQEEAVRTGTWGSLSDIEKRRDKGPTQGAAPPPAKPAQSAQEDPARDQRHKGHLTPLTPPQDTTQPPPPAEQPTERTAWSGAHPGESDPDGSDRSAP